MHSFLAFSPFSAHFYLHYIIMVKGPLHNSSTYSMRIVTGLYAMNNVNEAILYCYIEFCMLITHYVSNCTFTPIDKSAIVFPKCAYTFYNIIHFFSYSYRN